MAYFKFRDPDDQLLNRVKKENCGYCKIYI